MDLTSATSRELLDELARRLKTPSSAFGRMPAGLKVVRDTDWTFLDWGYLRRSGSLDAALGSDAKAPHSPPSILCIPFSPSMRPDSAPTVHWTTLEKSREAYAGWFQKMSSNWTPSPAGAGKIAFFHFVGGGQFYVNTHGTVTPHVISVNTEYAPYGQRFWMPNRADVRVGYDRWAQIEVYAKSSSAPGVDDGMIQWWVNAELVGEYRLVVPAEGFEQFEFSPTRQTVPTTIQYLWIDHTRVAVR